MAQFCRYRDHMCSGDANWCEVRGKTYSDAHLKHTNRCRLFHLNPIDALMLNARGYRPRLRAPNGQMTIWEFLEA